MKKKYIVQSEFGRKYFKTYKSLKEWIIPYWPEWLHKLDVFRKDGDLLIRGQFRRNNRWPIKF